MIANRTQLGAAGGTDHVYTANKTTAIVQRFFNFYIYLTIRDTGHPKVPGTTDEQHSGSTDTAV